MKTLKHIILAICHGQVVTCRNRRKWIWGWQHDYYDCMHACLHCGFFSIEVYY